jgi:hypothetical protein
LILEAPRIFGAKMRRLMPIGWNAFMLAPMILAASTLVARAAPAQLPGGRANHSIVLGGAPASGKGAKGTAFTANVFIKRRVVFKK